MRCISVSLLETLQLAQGRELRFSLHLFFSLSLLFFRSLFSSFSPNFSTTLPERQRKPLSAAFPPPSPHHVRPRCTPCRAPARPAAGRGRDPPAQARPPAHPPAQAPARGPQAPPRPSPQGLHFIFPSQYFMLQPFSTPQNPLPDGTAPRTPAAADTAGKRRPGRPRKTPAPQ